MKIVNQSKQVTLADKVFFADTIFKRMRGLLGRKSMNKGEALIITPANSIHTFFMRFPIDILFLDKNNKIIKTISCLKPFRLTSIYFNATSAVELPIGTIQSLSIQKGDILSQES